MTASHNLSIEDSLQLWWLALQEKEAADPLSAENVALVQASGRITAAPIYASINSPHYRAAAMDGYAVQAVETSGATVKTPILLSLDTQAIPVDTGDPVPDGYDAVMMVERAERFPQSAEQATHIKLVEALPPHKHIRAIGEDFQKGERIVPENHRLRPVDIGAIAGAGHTEINVYRRPTVAILPTGTELVAPGTDLKPGDIIEYNSLMLAAMAQEWGVAVSRLPKAPDSYGAIKAAVQEALQSHDLVVVNAGSSAGREDYTAAIFRDLGEVVSHGIAMRPGHPAILGYADLGNLRKPLVGIPGYPVSAVITFQQLVKPLIDRWQGQRAIAQRATFALQATLTADVHSPASQDEFLRVSLQRVEGQLLATPVRRGAGVVMSLVRADGVVRIPRGCEGYLAETLVDVERL